MKDVRPINSEDVCVNANFVKLKENKRNSEPTFTKIVVDEDLFARECKQRVCPSCHSTNTWSDTMWKTYGNGISPTFQMKCNKCSKVVYVTTSRKWIPPACSHYKSKLNFNTVILFVAVLLSGLTLTPVCVFFSLIFIHDASCIV